MGNGVWIRRLGIKAGQGIQYNLGLCASAKTSLHSSASSSKVNARLLCGVAGVSRQQRGLECTEGSRTI